MAGMTEEVDLLRAEVELLRDRANRLWSERDDARAERDRVADAAARVIDAAARFCDAFDQRFQPLGLEDVYPALRVAVTDAVIDAPMRILPSRNVDLIPDTGEDDDR